MIFAIDPGPEKSAYVVWNGEKVSDCQHLDNVDLLKLCLHGSNADYAHGGLIMSLVVEGVESFGMAVGKETFETVFWSGRFCQAWPDSKFVRVYRKEVKLHLCGSCRAKDTNIRQAILDRFGGKEKAVGKKASKGPLYGVSGHTWSALALAITAFDQNLAR